MAEWSPDLADENLSQPAAGETFPLWDAGLADERLNAELKARVGDAARQAGDAAPDAMARASVLARKAGLPVGAVLADLPEFEANDIAERFWSAPAATRAFLADPVNAAIAKDDVGNLSALERAWNKLSAEFGAGIATNRLGFLGNEAMGFGLTEDRKAGIDTLRKEIETADNANAGVWFLDKMAGPAARMLGQQWEGIPRRGAAAMAGAGTAIIAGQLGPQVALPEEVVTAPLAAATGWAAQSAAESAMIEQGMAWLELNDIRGKNGERLDPTVQSAAASVVGLVNGSLEMVGAHAVAKPVLEAGKKLLSQGVKEYAATEAGQSALKTFAKAYGGAIVGETTTEVMQEMTNIAAEEVAKMASDGTFDRLATSEAERVQAIDRIMGIAAQTAGGMALLGIPGAGMGAYSQSRAAAKAKATEAALVEAGAAVEGSKLNGRDGEKMRELIRAIAGEDGAVHIPADQLQQLYQSGVIDDFALDDWDIAGQLPEALSAGGDIIIPADRFLTARVKPEQYAQVIRHVRAAPGDWTAAEADSYLSDPEREKDITSLVESLFVQYDNAKPGQAVYDDVFRQLMETGKYRESEAAAQATLVAERMAQRARDRGMDPDALWVEERVRILGPQQATALRRDDLDVVLERLKSGNTVATARTPIINILKEKGGVAPGSPLAGELEAMGITPKSAPGLFRAGGMTDADNIVVSEYEVLRDNAVAQDSTGNGYADQDALLQAIGREWAGNPLTTTADAERIARLDEPVRQLRDLLERFGLDPATATKAQVLEAMDRADAVAPGQPSAQALEQAINAGVDPSRMVQVADITGMFDAARDKKSLMQMLRPLVGERLDTADQGRIARILPRKVDHIAFSVMRADQRRTRRNIGAAVNGIVDLLERAVLIESAPNRKTADKPGIDSYHRFYVPVWDGTATRTVRIVAEQSKDGIRIDPNAFDIYEMMEEAGAPADGNQASQPAPLAGGHQKAPPRTERPRTISIRQMLTGVKDMKGVPYFQTDGAPERTNADGAAPIHHVRNALSGTASSVVGADEIVNQPDGGIGARGSFDPADDTIRLFQESNLSTFLHESGHLWVFQMIRDLGDSRLLPDARERIASDLQTWLNWAGAKVDVRQSTPDQIIAAMHVQHHEKMARAVEAYLMEGKAPSAALADVFQRFSAWLVNIYRKIRNLNVRLTPQVRAVMDRLLASDEAIEAARSSTIFTVPTELAGVLTEAERSRIEALSEQAALEAKREMQGQVMKELARERLVWWKEERAKVREEVVAELRRRPVYAALNLMKRGESPDGSPLLDESGERRKLKMDRKALVSEYGEEIVKLLPAGVTATKGGVNHHLLAGMLGFDNGDALRLALMNVEPFNDVVERETDSRMTERHGDIIADGRIAEDAAEIVGQGKQVEVVALQARYLRRLAGDEMKKAAGRVVAEQGAGTAKDDRAAIQQAEAATDQVVNAGAPAEGAVTAQVGEEMAKATAAVAPLQRRAQASAVRTVRNMLKGMNGAAIKEAARRFIEARPVSQAVTPDRYRQQALRLARKAELAIAARDYEAAADAKEQQLLNLYLAMHAREAVKRVDSARKRFQRLNKPDATLGKTMDIDFARAARSILARYGLARADSDFTMDSWLEQLRQTDPAGAADIESMVANLTSFTAQPGRVFVRTLPNGTQVTTPEFQHLAYGDFRALVEGVDALMHQGRVARSVELDGERVAFDDIIEQAEQQLAPRLKAPALDHIPTDQERNRMGLLGLVASAKRVETWARDLDDGKVGVFTKYLVRPVLQAVYAYRDAKREKMRQVLDILKPARDELGRRRVIAAPELGFEFHTKGQLLHAILHTGNDSNMKKLVLGFGWGRKLPDGGYDRSRWDAFINRMFAEGVVTKADMDMVQSIWDLLEDTKAPAQQAHRKMFGFYFGEIEPRPVDTPFGRYRGGYVPAVTDKALTDDGGTHLDADALANQQNAAMFPGTDKGFTKGRVDYNQPLALDLLMIPGHVDKVLKFIHLGPVVRDAARLVKNRDFGALMGQVDRVAVNNLLIPWLQRVSRQTVETPATGEGGRMGDRMFRWLRKSAGMQAMVGNLLNAAQQVTGVSSAAVMVKPGYLMRSLVTVWRDPEHTRAAITTKSAFMRDRMDSSAHEVAADIDDILRDHTPLGKARKVAERHGYFAQQIMQNLVDRVVWAGAYDAAIAKGLDEASAVAEADSVVRTSQGSFAPEDVSRIETGPTWARLFTMFYSYFNAQANLIGTEAAIAIRQSGWKGAADKLFYLYLVGGVLPAVVAEAIMQAAKGELGDEEDDGWLDDLAELFLLSQLRYFAAMVPGVGQGINFLINLGNDKPYDDRLSTAPALTMLEGAGKAVVTVPKALFADGDASRAVADGINAVGMVIGIPLGWLRKPASYAVDVAEGDSNPQHLGNVVSGVLTGKDGTGR